MEAQSLQPPPRGRVRRVIKAKASDSSPSALAQLMSQQLPEDDFRSLYGADIQEPPFEPAQLVYLAEQHPIHQSCIEQKAIDVIGQGWEWENEGKDPKGGPSQGSTGENTGERDRLEEWFSNLADIRRDETVHEILLNAWEDLECVGWGVIELARDPGGKVRYMYPMPAHTIRFGREGVRIVQIRQGKRVWFKRWIPNDQRVVGAHNGVIYPDRKSAGRVKVANEVLVLKRPSRRSTWYGIPKFVSALGWLTLSVIARDDNILYFDNRREPRWAIVLTNIDDDPSIEDDLQDAFRVDLKQPHRNLIIPIEGPGTIDFKQLTDLSKNDMSFDKLQQRSGDYLLVAHRVPPDRVGAPRAGALGGDISLAASLIYKDAVVVPAQAVISARMNRFIKYEGPVESPTWEWKPNPLDLSEAEQEAQTAVTTFQAGVITLNEARRRIGEPELPEDDPRGHMFITELGMAAGGGPGGAPGQPNPFMPGQPEGPGGQADTSRQLGEAQNQIESLQEQLSSGNPDSEGIV